MSETNPHALVAELRERAECPMWADHAEVSKRLLTRAADLIAQHAAREEALTKELAEIRDLSAQWMEETGQAYAYVGIRDYAAAKAALTAAEAEVGRLRAGLEWYAGDGSTYDGIDVGQRARACLSPAKKEG